jgi:hypothetical protein
MGPLLASHAVRSRVGRANGTRVGEPSRVEGHRDACNPSRATVVERRRVAVCGGHPNPANSKQDRRAEYLKGMVERRGTEKALANLRKAIA